jgi:hypothetical protein
MTELVATIALWLHTPMARHSGKECAGILRTCEHRRFCGLLGKGQEDHIVFKPLITSKYIHALPCLHLTMLGFLLLF